MASDPAALPPGLMKAMRAIEARALDTTSTWGGVADAVIEQAAVIGMFDLPWLDRRIDKGDRQTVRSAVIKVCDCLDRANGIWRLQLDRRRELVVRLRETPDRIGRLIETARPISGDDRAPLLAAALRNHVIPELAHVPADVLPALLDVATWLQGLSFPLPEPRKVRREVARRTRLASFGEVSTRFVGRTRELDRLNEFAFAPARVDMGLQLLSVTGIGGIGKSALLARFLHQSLAEPMPSLEPASLIVQIDFDRVWIQPSDWNQLDFELTRQLALAAPDLAGPLDRLRGEVRRSRRERQGVVRTDDGSASPDVSSARTIILESIDFARTDILAELSQICADAGLLAVPLLFVLDTMEELQGHSEHALSDLAEWFQLMQRRTRFTDVRVIASGRAEIAFPAELADHAQPIILDELDTAPAIALLGRLGIDQATSRRAVTIYGGNPLVLRLVARLLKLRGPALLDEPDMADGGVIDRELVQGVLYERVLGHIRNSRVKRLAYPGLVLRRVTPDLIRAVIAPISLEPPLEVGEEVTLFKALRREVWLVKHGTSDDEVEHRSDIRRVMMAMMRKDVARRAEGQAVHRAAIAHYEEDASAEVRLGGEALYHRFMIEGGAALPHLDAETADRARAAIGLSIDELPEENRAALRVALGEAVTEAEARLAPAYLWDNYVARRGPELVEREDYAKALELVGDGTPSETQASRAGSIGTSPVREFADRAVVGLPAGSADRYTAAPLTEWHATALDATGRWQELAERLEAVGVDEAAGISPLQRGTTIAAALLKAGQPQRAFKIATAALAEPQPEEGRRGLAERLRCAQIAARTFAALGGDPHTQHLAYRLTTADLLSDEALAGEHLRYLQVTGRTIAQPFRPLHSLFYPSLAWLDELIALGGDPLAQALAKLVDDFRALEPGRLTTARLLSHFGSLFGQAMIDPFARSAIPPAARAHLGVVREHAEFRTAARVAILQALDTEARCRSVAAALAPALPIVPDDLRNVYGSSQRERVEFVTALVALADRCQTLALLVDIVRDVSLPTPAITTLAVALAHWQTPAERADEAAMQPYHRPMR